MQGIPVSACVAGNAAGGAGLYGGGIGWGKAASLLLRRRNAGHAERSCGAVLLCIIAIVLGAFVKTRYFVHALHSCAVAGIGFTATVWVIPGFMAKLSSKGLWGRDLNKIPPVACGKDRTTTTTNGDDAMRDFPEEQKIPESLGIVAASVFILLTIASQVVFSTNPTRLLEYNAALLSITFMTFLGFADDVLDLRWRYKMTLPFFASLPLLFSYMGGTVIVIPVPLQPLLGEFLDLGHFYHLYMSCLAVFCTNSINIYAGINGLEVGQSVVIAVAVVAYNTTELLRSSAAGISSQSIPIDENGNIFSILFSLPFIGCSLGLLAYNWYPSRVFVGDTYTYFAGVLFAVVGISGHFSRTLLLFFMPQIVNFLLSIPQLVGIIPCPRHRVPRIDLVSGKLHPTPNLTLINLTLRVLGPLSERRLVIILLAVQAACCLLGFTIRYSALLGVLFV